MIWSSPLGAAGLCQKDQICAGHQRAHIKELKHFKSSVLTFMASVYARSCTLTYTFLLCRVEGTHVSDGNVSCLVTSGTVFPAARLLARIILSILTITVLCFIISKMVLQFLFSGQRTRDCFYPADSFLWAKNISSVANPQTSDVVLNLRREETALKSRQSTHTQLSLFSISDHCYSCPWLD